MALFSVVSAVNVRYDRQYDDVNGKPTSIDCFATGAASPHNALAGVTNFGDVPTFPNITAADVFTANAAGCGSCWEISYGVNSITVTVVDHASDGFSLTLDAMNVLTDGHGDTGVINANAHEIDCGL